MVVKAVDPTLFSRDELFAWVQAQAALGPRRPGSPAGKANEDFLFSQLQSFGLKHIRREPVPVTHWEPSERRLSIDGTEVACFAIPYTAFTPPTGIDAPLIRAGAGRLFPDRRWKGKIVVAEIRFPDLDPEMLLKLSFGAHDPEGTLKSLKHPATWIRLGWHLYHWAAAAGAVGFIGILKDQPGGSCRMYAPYGFREKDILDKPIPGVWVGRDAGKALLAKAEAGATARLVLTGTQRPASSHNIVGEIEGRSDEALVLSCHHDSPFTSPVEDGTGVAVVLALARALARGPKLNRKTIVLFTSGHFYGSAGTRAFIERQKDLSRIALEISIEHIALEAVEDESGALKPSGLPEPVGIFVPFNSRIQKTVREAVAKADLRRTLVLPAEGPLGDFPPTDGGDWYGAGVPLINYISNPVYLLTDDDALRWVDKERLPVVASLFFDLIRSLDEVPAKDLRRLDYPVRLAAMKTLKHVVRAKSTFFGIRSH